MTLTCWSAQDNAVLVWITGVASRAGANRPVVLDSALCVQSTGSARVPTNLANASQQIAALFVLVALRPASLTSVFLWVEPW